MPPKIPEPAALEFARRLHVAMVAEGVVGPTALGKLVGVNKQTADGWMKGKHFNVQPRHLFALADKLHVSPRWLGTGKGPPQPGVRLSDDEGRLLAIFRALDAKQQAAYLRQGSDLLEASGKTSPGNPFTANGLSRTTER